MSIQDAYKWLYHAANGGEHAITDVSRVSDWMEREWAGLDLDFRRAEQEITPLDPWGRMIRVNLRPAKRREVPPGIILNWFVKSAQRFQKDELGFQVKWRVLGLSLQRTSEAFPFTRADWERFDLEAGASNYPAVHHSHEYGRVNGPAYRVGLAELWAR